MSSMTGQGVMQSGAGKSGNKIPSGYKHGQLQQFTPQQMELFSQLLGELGPDSYTARLARGDEGEYAKMEEPALRQFAGMQGNLASRFSGMGRGATKSSGFQNTSNQASSDFAGQLQANRMNIRNQAIKDLQGYGNSLLNQRPYEQFLTQKQPKPGMDWASIAKGGAMGGIQGFMAGGPPGALAGAAMGAGAGALGGGGGMGMGGYGGGQNMGPTPQWGAGPGKLY